MLGSSIEGSSALLFCILPSTNPVVFYERSHQKNHWLGLEWAETARARYYAELSRKSLVVLIYFSISKLLGVLNARRSAFDWLVPHASGLVKQITRRFDGSMRSRPCVDAQSETVTPTFSKRAAR